MRAVVLFRGIPSCSMCPNGRLHSTATVDRNSRPRPPPRLSPSGATPPSLQTETPCIPPCLHIPRAHAPGADRYRMLSECVDSTVCWGIANTLADLKAMLSTHCKASAGAYYPLAPPGPLGALPRGTKTGETISPQILAALTLPHIPEKFVVGPRLGFERFAHISWRFSSGCLRLGHKAVHHNSGRDLLQWWTCAVGNIPHTCTHTRSLITAPLDSLDLTAKEKVVPDLKNAVSFISTGHILVLPGGSVKCRFCLVLGAHAHLGIQPKGAYGTCTTDAPFYCFRVLTYFPRVLHSLCSNPAGSAPDSLTAVHLTKAGGGSLRTHLDVGPSPDTPDAVAFCPGSATKYCICSASCRRGSPVQWTLGYPTSTAALLPLPRAPPRPFPTETFPPPFLPFRCILAAGPASPRPATEVYQEHPEEVERVMSAKIRPKFEVALNQGATLVGREAAEGVWSGHWRRASLGGRDGRASKAHRCWTGVSAVFELRLCPRGGGGGAGTEPAPPRPLGGSASLPARSRPSAHPRAAGRVLPRTHPRATLVPHSTAAVDPTGGRQCVQRAPSAVHPDTAGCRPRLRTWAIPTGLRGRPELPSVCETSLAARHSRTIRPSVAVVCGECGRHRVTTDPPQSRFGPPNPPAPPSSPGIVPIGRDLRATSSSSPT